MSRRTRKDQNGRVSEGWFQSSTYLAGTCLILSILFATSLLSAADKLRVSYASVTGNTAGITYIAQRAGLFEKQGLDVEIILITGGPASISALLNGDVDLDMRAPIAAMQAMAHGVKLTFLLSHCLLYTSPSPRDS